MALLTVSSACTFDEAKLRNPSARALDAAVDRAPDAVAVQLDTEGSMDLGPRDSALTDYPLPDAGIDGSQEHGQDSIDGPPATDQASPAAGKDTAPYQDATVGTDNGLGMVPDGTYRVIARHSGKALEVNFEFTADGSNVDQWTYDGGKNQQWTFTQLAGNVYQILGAQSGKALEVASASAADNTNVDIRAYTGAPNQKWMITALDGGYYRLSPLSSSGSALDVEGPSVVDGANVHQWTWQGTGNQQWSIEPP